MPKNHFKTIFNISLINRINTVITIICIAIWMIQVSCITPSRKKILTRSRPDVQKQVPPKKLLEPSVPDQTTEPKGRSMPYRVDATTYYPLTSAEGYKEEGIASWYGPQFHGKKTSNRETYNMEGMTAAHKTLPFNTLVKVTNLENGLEAIVRINDCGPFVDNRIIDLSRRAARELKIIQQGTVRVQITALNNSEPEDNPGATVNENQVFSVQVAVFQNPENANRVKNQLENSWIKIYLNGGIESYRVLTGNYKNFENTIELRDKVRQNGFPDAFVVVVSSAEIENNNIPAKVSREFVGETLR